jgi:hypothetical protein
MRYSLGSPVRVPDAVNIIPTSSFVSKVGCIKRKNNPKSNEFIISDAHTIYFHEGSLEVRLNLFSILSIALY